MTKLLAFAAAVEAGTGLALLAMPMLVIRLLLGVAGTGEGLVLARFLGIALFALGVACWPVAGRAAAWRAMLLYNALVALYLAFIGAVGPMSGVLLWPAVALHGVVALLLLRGRARAA